MQVRELDLARDGRGPQAVVVIDVLRSFTTAAFAFAGGVTAIFPVATVAEGLALRERRPRAVTLGAQAGGLPIPEFDLGNSPSQLAGHDLRGRELIHCTAAGVRALVRYGEAGALFAAGLVCARATADALRRLGAARVTLVTTGEWVDRDGDEDHACADYLEALLLGNVADPAPFARRVRDSDFGRRFVDPGHPAHPAADLDCAAAADRFAFAMRVGRRDGQLVLLAEP